MQLGVCVVGEADEGCDPPPATCPDGMTTAWYREVGLEVGAVEVVSYGMFSICDDHVDGFMPCTYDDATETYTPPECSCVCPMGE